MNCSIKKSVLQTECSTNIKRVDPERLKTNKYYIQHLKDMEKKKKV